MTLPVAPDDFLRFAHPRYCAPEYVHAFDGAQAILDEFEITQSIRRLAHFIAQVMCETGALRAAIEDLDYTSDRIRQVWPSRFLPRGPLDPREYAGKPCKLADTVYGGRMDNDAAGDGFKFRGRGLLQLTGKANYASASALLLATDATAPDLVVHPDQVTAPAWCLRVAAAYWKDKYCNEAADANNIASVTLAVCGGMTDIATRRYWFSKVLPHVLQRAGQMQGRRFQ